jgi:hypothetical protein
MWCTRKRVHLTYDKTRASAKWRQTQVAVLVNRNHMHYSIASSAKARAKGTWYRWLRHYTLVSECSCCCDQSSLPPSHLNAPSSKTTLHRLLCSSPKQDISKTKGKALRRTRTCNPQMSSKSDALTIRPAGPKFWYINPLLCMII